MTSVGDTEEFKNATIRRSKAARCLIAAVLLTLILRQMAENATDLTFVYMGVVAAGVAVLLIGFVRSLRMGISLSARGVVVRTTFSTRSWRWGKLERVDSIDVTSRGGPLGIGTYTTQRTEPHTTIIPVFHPAGRSPIPVRGLRIATNSPNDANWLDDALHEVNRAILEHRAPPDPRPGPR